METRNLHSVPPVQARNLKGWAQHGLFVLGQADFLNPEDIQRKRQRCSSSPLRTNQVGACSFQQQLLPVQPEALDHVVGPGCWRTEGPKDPSSLHPALLLSLG